MSVHVHWIGRHRPLLVSIPSRLVGRRPRRLGTFVSALVDVRPSSTASKRRGGLGRSSRLPRLRGVSTHPGIGTNEVISRHPEGLGDSHHGDPRQASEALSTRWVGERRGGWFVRQRALRYPSVLENPQGLS